MLKESGGYGPMKISPFYSEAISNPVWVFFWQFGVFLKIHEKIFLALKIFHYVVPEDKTAPNLVLRFNDYF